MEKINFSIKEEGKIRVVLDFTTHEWFTVLKALNNYAETLTNPVEYDAVMRIFAAF